MKLAVFGANGPTGRLLTRLALDEDHDVVAFTRHPDAFPIEHPRLEVAAGDVHDAGAVAAAIDGTDAVRLDPRRAVRQDADHRLFGRRHQHHRRACTPPASSGSCASAPARWVRIPSRSAGSSSRRSCSPTSSTSSARPCTTTCAGWRRSCPRATSRGRSSARRGCSRRRLSPTYGVAIDHIGYRFTARIDLADCLLRQAVERHVRAHDDRGRDAERQAVDAEADLAGRHPQEVVSCTPMATDTMGTRIEPHPAPTIRRSPRSGTRTAAGCSISPFACCSTSRDAEDVVQEAFTRLARTDIDAHRRPRGLAGRRHQPAVPRPAPRAAAAPDRRRSTSPAIPSTRTHVDPSSQVTLVDNVTLAMHALLERLSPAERTSFVLHDVFQYSFDDVADHRRASTGRVPAAGQPGAPDPARRVGGRPLPGRLRAATRDQRAIHRGVHGWRSGRAAGVARPNRRRRRRRRPGGRGRRGRSRAGNPALPRVRTPSPTLLYLPVGDRVGIVALRDRRVLALILLTIDNGLVVHVDALAGAGPRAAVSEVLGLR